jgi:hypothetical protein
MPVVEKYVYVRARSEMTALKEWRSPQWNVTYGGRALFVASLEPGSEVSMSMIARILFVCSVTETPLCVVSKKRSTDRVPGSAPV